MEATTVITMIITTGIWTILWTKGQDFVLHVHLFSSCAPLDEKEMILSPHITPSSSSSSNNNNNGPSIIDYPEKGGKFFLSCV